MFDLAPTAKAEPGNGGAQRAPSLPSLAEPVRALRDDGRSPARPGRSARRATRGPASSPSSRPGRTTSRSTIPLKFPFAAAIPLGNGHRVIGRARGHRRRRRPRSRSSTSTPGSPSELASGLQGGAISISAMATSPDGARVVAVGSYSDGNVGRSVRVHVRRRRARRRRAPTSPRYARRGARRPLHARRKDLRGRRERRTAGRVGHGRSPLLRRDGRRARAAA